MRKYSIALGFAAVALALLGGAASGHEENASILPTRIAVLPFRCPKACQDLAQLQAALESQVLEDSLFDLVMTKETEDIFLTQPRYQRAFDDLTARAISGNAPDSATGVALARRFQVDGFLYAYMTSRGPVVELWTATPRPSVVYHYQQTRQETHGSMPDARHEGAETKVATAPTGGSNSTNGAGQTVHADATAQMPQSDTRTQPQLLASSAGDDNSRETSEIICKELRKLRPRVGEEK